MRSLFWATLVFSTLTSSVVSAHLQLMAPPPRFTYTADGIKMSPCGSGTRTNMVTSFLPGASVMVTWRETIAHGGHFRIALSAAETDFVAPTSLTVPATPPSWVLMDGIADKTGTMTYNQMVTLPTTECPACVMQVIQVMSGTDGGNTGTFSGNYFTCADVRISATATGTGGSGAGGRAGTGGGAGTGGRAGGTGGSGSGGRAGTGGTVGGTGGTVGGTGGTVSSTGGRTNTGGATVSGSGGLVATSGGAPGSGGATTTGTGGASTSTGGAAGTGPDLSGEEPPACTCGVTGSSRLPATGVVFGMLVALAVRRGRTRRK